MEYENIEKVVKKIEKGDVNDVYSDLMAQEKDAVRVVERVSDDIRHKVIESSSLWNTSLSELAKDYVEFVKSTYAMIMNNQGDHAVRRLLSPDGLISVGITLLILTVLLSLLRL